MFLAISEILIYRIIEQLRRICKYVFFLGTCRCICFPDWATNFYSTARDWWDRVCDVVMAGLSGNACGGGGSFSESFRYFLQASKGNSLQRQYKVRGTNNSIDPWLYSLNSNFVVTVTSAMKATSLCPKICHTVSTTKLFFICFVITNNLLYLYMLYRG